jgi:hypothetical protein
VFSAVSLAALGEQVSDIHENDVTVHAQEQYVVVGGKRKGPAKGPIKTRRGYLDSRIVTVGRVDVKRGSSLIGEKEPIRNLYSVERSRL